MEVHLNTQRDPLSILNVEEQFVSLRVDVQKNQAIPTQLRALKNESVLLQSSISALNGEFVQMQADISNISEETTNSRSDLKSTKANVVSLKADTTTLKGDTHNGGGPKPMEQHARNGTQYSPRAKNTEDRHGPAPW